MPLTRAVTTSRVRAQHPPNPLLFRAFLRRRLFSDLAPRSNAQAALAETARRDDPPRQPQRQQHRGPRGGSGSRVFDFQAPPPSSAQATDLARSGDQQQGLAGSSYTLVRDAQRRWQQDRRAHTTGQARPPPPPASSRASGQQQQQRRPNAAAAGVLDGMLESIFPPSSPASPSLFSSSTGTTGTAASPTRQRLDFAARWAAEVKALDRNLSLSPRDAYATRVRSSLGSNAVTAALRRMKRLVHASEMRKKLFSERAHERPGLRRKRLRMVRWRRRFAGDFNRICQRANKLAAQGW
jgi:hypothetical protein